MKNTFFVITAMLALVTPSFVFAVTPLTTIPPPLLEVFYGLAPFFLALALLFFFWGLSMLILNAGNEKKRTEGRRVMITGVIVLFIMFSIFGIIAAFQNTFEFRNQGIQEPSATPQGQVGP